MLGPGGSRRHIAHLLNTACGDGLLSEETLAHRLDQMFVERLIEPRALIGDLNLPSAHSRCHQRLREAAAAALAGVVKHGGRWWPPLKGRSRLAVRGWRPFPPRPAPRAASWTGTVSDR